MLLIFSIASFYAGDELNFSNFLFKFLLVTLITDFVYIALHLFRKPVYHKKLSFDPKKLTVVIACYNGEDVIAETIKSAMVHVPPSQIIVVSDKSTDNTVAIARSLGAITYENARNVNKAFSVSNIVRMVKTPYVLVVDDDTLIGNTLIPTNLLEEGYSGVAFNVMPIPTGKLINKLQLFEYRKSMFLGKALRGGVGAIGNVSGAIGLFNTYELQRQVHLHSGQFGGEDQQRTVLVHIYGSNKGVTYTNGTVETHAPNTIKAWLRQRAFRWNLSLPELFTLYWRVLFDIDQHYLLKIEKAYQLFLYATDPLRILLVWAAFFYPERLVLLYFFYLFLSMATWIKLDRKDPFWIIIIYPIYTHIEMVCRFVAHFYWFKIKYKYIFKEHFHKIVTGRRIVLEYFVVAFIIVAIWVASIRQVAVTAKTINKPAPVYTTVTQPLPIDILQIERNIQPYITPSNTGVDYTSGQGGQ